MGSVHAVHPHGDGDKCICRVRISGKATRVAATKPSQLTCDTCILRVVRTWQGNCDIGDIQQVIDDGRYRSTWPWDDPSYVKDPPKT